MITSTQKGILDRGTTEGKSIKTKLGENLDRTEKLVTMTYDFSTDGGATGDITPALTYTFEEDAVITEVLTDELTTLTSGGAATVKVKAGSTDVTGTIAFDTGFTGDIDSHALASSAAGIKVSSGDVLKINVGTAALTAGKVRFYVKARPQRDL